jgi:hypothetical protein
VQSSPTLQLAYTVTVHDVAVISVTGSVALRPASPPGCIHPVGPLLQLVDTPL